jgi:hypothetical protein
MGEVETNGSSSTPKRKPSPFPTQTGEIEQTQKKVEQFERAGSGAPQSAAVVDIFSLSDEDDDDYNDSSSEEE